MYDVDHVTVLPSNVRHNVLRHYQVARAMGRGTWITPPRWKIRDQVVFELREQQYSWIQIAMLALAIFQAVTWIIDRLRESE
jgi:hypothetical protein